MTNSPGKPAKQDDPGQAKRFIEMAREVGVDERPEAFEQAFKAVIAPSHHKEKNDPKTVS
jgi:hypothetical protein